MLSVIILLVSVGLLDARPSTSSFKIAFSNRIIGGEDALPGEFPWQLSQQRQGALMWSHSCGASLLRDVKALSAAHCVINTDPTILRVRAGLHQRTNDTNVAFSDVSTYTTHPSYSETGTPTFANDIAILDLATPISTADNIAYATLPSDNSNDFAGTTCVISGWGRTGSGNILPIVLQKASIDVIDQAECQRLVEPVTGTGGIWEGHICLYDTANSTGSCNGDSGGPLNCPSGGSTVVAGVTSWGISDTDGNCMQIYPSVYTRTSYYLQWISDNMMN